MTTIVHVDDTVRDYETWKPAFDGLERYFAEAGARNCRVARFTHNPNRVLVELDFDTMAEAEAFRDGLRKLIELPRTQMLLISHEVSLLELVEDHRLTLEASS
ncbi:hypothetical protein IU470_18130 [Nocardia abscessus]|uniref:Cyclase n=1 Tax=Nocardia abscessus TaxID=120957 RepID=A0ABS0C9H9_9NOCA|nr:hypothetical protein [Nocardia abscessus]MBF6227014.1 hypothetical protein [Nocardia abscessus]